MGLTTTQYSALGELQRYGSLTPSRRAFTNGRRTFSKRTLEALEQQGYGTWRSDGDLVPTPHEPARFTASYMQNALYNLPGVLKRAQQALGSVDFDTIVGTGFSGGIVIPALALAMGKQFLLIRKETDDSHHGKGRLVGSLGSRWIFVDDFVSSGRTRDRVLAKVAAAAAQRSHPTAYVGLYQYETAFNDRNNFQEA